MHQPLSSFVDIATIISASLSNTYPIFVFTMEDLLDMTPIISQLLRYVKAVTEWLLGAFDCVDALSWTLSNDTLTTTVECPQRQPFFSFPSITWSEWFLNSNGFSTLSLQMPLQCIQVGSSCLEQYLVHRLHLPTTATLFSWKTLTREPRHHWAIHSRQPMKRAIHCRLMHFTGTTKINGLVYSCARACCWWDRGWKFQYLYSNCRVFNKYELVAVFSWYHCYDGSFVLPCRADQQVSSGDMWKPDSMIQCKKMIPADLSSNIIKRSMPSDIAYAYGSRTLTSWSVCCNKSWLMSPNFWTNDWLTRSLLLSKRMRSIEFSNSTFNLLIDLLPDQVPQILTTHGKQVLQNAHTVDESTEGKPWIDTITEI